MKFAELAMATQGHGERQAALMLHGLTEVDQAWLIGQLAPDQQQRLRERLTELKAMGVAPDVSRIWAAVNATPQLDKAALDDQTFLMQLSAGAVTTLALALRREPASLVAQCLLVGPWPWTADLLERLPAVQRRQVEDLRTQIAALPIVASRAAALRRALRDCCAPKVPPVLIETAANHQRRSGNLRQWFAMRWRRSTRP